MRGSKDIVKYSPRKTGHLNVKKLHNVIFNNSKYLSVPHGVPEHLKKSSVFSDKSNGNMDRNKIYAMRSDNPIVLPASITDIPV
jgi:hypothetical protein